VETAKRLIKQRRLSLILDLDQTVIHATVQPSVEAWLQDPVLAEHPSLKVRSHLATEIALATQIILDNL
jgi:RNA polymerase II subunit A-like phosphatase